MNGLIIDNFAGGGGASTGIYMALGRSPDFAINHNEEALAMHEANHPDTVHLIEDVWNVDPVKLCDGKPVDLAWFSPDCKHFSKAKGGKPVSKKIRGLAWVAVKWAKAKHPKVIMLENVEEFKDWGPVGPDDMPIKAKMGFTFRRFVRALEKEGYRVEYRELRACDYGAPTTRKRLFLIARCDGKPIVWPEPTHGPGRAPYLSAADCIDFTLPCPSIFTRKRPLADNTLRRIARGIQKFVIDEPNPFIIPVSHSGGENRSHGLDEPLRTITGSSGSTHAMVTPYVTRIGHTGHGDAGRSRGMDDPLSTITSKAEHLLVAPYLVPRYGERPGQDPRCLSARGPMPTIVPTGNGAGLVAAFLAKHNGGNEATGQRLVKPCDTITATDTKALVTSSLVKLRGTSKHGQPVSDPLHTVSAQGNHFGEVRAFLIKFYSEGGQWASLKDPMHTIPTVDRMGLVTVHGEPYQIVDIGMRMLTARELFRAQGFPEAYIIDRRADGRKLTARSQVRMCGNSVSPDMAEALVMANCGDLALREAA